MDPKLTGHSTCIYSIHSYMYAYTSQNISRISVKIPTAQPKQTKAKEGPCTKIQFLACSHTHISGFTLCHRVSRVFRFVQLLQDWIWHDDDVADDNNDDDGSGGGIPQPGYGPFGDVWSWVELEGCVLVDFKHVQRTHHPNNF